MNSYLCKCGRQICNMNRNKKMSWYQADWQNGNTLHSYSIGAQFESQSGSMVYWLRMYMTFLQMVGESFDYFTTPSLHILSNLSFLLHSTIHHYLVSLVRFPVLPDFLRSSGSGAGSSQPRMDIVYRKIINNKNMESCRYMWTGWGSGRLKMRW
jgi:hypothetical protein